MNFRLLQKFSWGRKPRAQGVRPAQHGFLKPVQGRESRQEDAGTDLLQSLLPQLQQGRRHIKWNQVHVGVACALTSR